MSRKLHPFSYIVLTYCSLNVYTSDSTIWVHKADLDGDDKVTEADYVLFKLQQMQKVDLQTLDILIDRFEELDAQHDVSSCKPTIPSP